MPELPEVQAHAERLTERFGGAVLERFTPLSFSVLKTVSPGPDEAVGAALAGVARRGKLLVLDFGQVSFVVHLMQGGRLVPDEAQSARPRNGMARWRFADGRALLLTEAGTERKAGVWVLGGDPLVQPPLDELGVDADVATRVQLAAALAERNQRLHGFLRDQHGLAGLGRMLANEVDYCPSCQTGGKILADNTTSKFLK